MATRTDLMKLARLRLKEAETLYRAGLYDGCVYLAGYVLELALKAKVCRLLHVDDYPEDLASYRTHDLERLKYLAGLNLDLASVDPRLFTNWMLLVTWRPEQRYDPLGTRSQGEAQSILEALRERPYGVLTWVSQRW